MICPMPVTGRPGRRLGLSISTTLDLAIGCRYQQIVNYARAGRQGAGNTETALTTKPLNGRGSMATQETNHLNVKTLSTGEAHYLADRIYGRSVSELFDVQPEVKRDMCMASRVIRALLHEVDRLASAGHRLDGRGFGPEVILIRRCAGHCAAPAFPSP
jgi:hypothetical protein